MKKFFSKIASVALAVVMSASVLTLAPITASAETLKSGDYKYDVINDGEARIVGYSGNATNLTIPSKINGLPVTEFAQKAFHGNTTITSITIPKTITAGATYCFANTKIKTAKIENGAKTVPSNLFHGCTTLESVTIPSTVTTIKNDAFNGCTSLKSIKLPSNLTSIGMYAFASTSITEITIPKTVSDGGSYAFKSSKLKTAVIENGATVVANNLFYGCKTLESVSIPNTVTTIGTEAFCGCTSLKSITLPSSLTTIKTWAFSNSGLTEITIPKNVTRIEGYSVGYNTTKKVEGFVIKGYAGTKAQEYAEKNKFTFVTLSEPKPAGIIGDVNKDGTLDVNDATYLQMHLAGYKNSNGTAFIDTYDSNMFMIADVNGDSVIDVADVTQIQMKLAGLA